MSFKDKIQHKYMDKAHRSATGKMFLAVFCLIGMVLFLRWWITGDGLGYYAYLRSPLFDGDLDFYNEFTIFNPLGHMQYDIGDPCCKRTITGLVPNLWPIGVAFLWSPFVLLAHLTVKALPLFGAHFPADGYSTPYVISVGTGTVFYGFLGMLVIFDISRRYCRISETALSTLTIWLASSLLYYMYFEPSYANALSTFTVGLFIALWNTYRNQDRLHGWLLMGAAGGLMISTLWQDIVFLLFPLWTWLRFGCRYIAQKAWSRLGRLILNGFALLTSGTLLFFPQLLAWKILFGGWFTTPRDNFMNWRSPAFLDVFLSTHNGLFPWAPVTLLGIIGLVFLYRKDRELSLCLFLSLLLVGYVNGAAADWWGGDAYGSRRLIDCTVVFVLGLAALLEQLSLRLGRWFSGALCGGAILWSLLSVTQYIDQLLNPATVDWRTLLFQQLTVAPLHLADLLKWGSFRGQMAQALQQGHYTTGIVSITVVATIYLLTVLGAFAASEQITHQLKRCEESYRGPRQQLVANKTTEKRQPW